MEEVEEGVEERNRGGADGPNRAGSERAVEKTRVRHGDWLLTCSPQVLHYREGAGQRRANV